MIKIVFVAFIALIAQHAHAMDVKCEKVTEKSCFMQNLTAIDSLGFMISSPRDETLEVLRLYDNKKIQFLPEEVYKQFPNLFMYKAYNCSIKEVSKINFKLLPKLRLLDLSRNQIERIESNTFEDLAAVQMISLCCNKIKFILGQAFKKLNYLKEIDLSSNRCIDDKFNFTVMYSLPEILSNSCGIEMNFEMVLFEARENGGGNVTNSLIAKVYEEQKRQSKIQETILKETEAEIACKKIENAKLGVELSNVKDLNDRCEIAGKDLKIQIATVGKQVQDKESEVVQLQTELEITKARCETELNAGKDLTARCEMNLKDEKDRYDGHVKFLEGFTENLEKQHNKTWAVKIDKLSSELDMKVKEIEELKKEGEKKNLEIIEKDRKIKKLIETLQNVRESIA